jgi:hypothetical protein
MVVNDLIGHLITDENRAPMLDLALKLTLKCRLHRILLNCVVQSVADVERNGSPVYCKYICMYVHGPSTLVSFSQETAVLFANIPLKTTFCLSSYHLLISLDFPPVFYLLILFFRGHRTGRNRTFSNKLGSRITEPILVHICQSSPNSICYRPYMCLPPAIYPANCTR